MILISSILLLLVVSSQTVSSEECQSKNICECVYNDGSGYNLKNIIQPENSRINGYIDDLEIFFNPCVDSKDLPNHNYTVNECKDGYTLCLYNATEQHAYLLGTTKNTKFKEEGGQMYITLNNTSTILLQCTVNAKVSTLYAPHGTKVNSTNLKLFSDSSCKSQVEIIEQPGFFSTFFLIAFIVLLVYLVVGIAYNHFLVGARGYELLPNYDFWMRVWSSIKLGFYYIKNGCRVLPNEDSYDAI